MVGVGPFGVSVCSGCGVMILPPASSIFLSAASEYVWTLIVSGLLMCPVASSLCIPMAVRSMVWALGFVVRLVPVVLGVVGGFSLSVSWSSCPMFMVVGLLVPLMLCGVLNPLLPK